jgi:hypothetical protein
MSSGRTPHGVARIVQSCTCPRISCRNASAKESTRADPADPRWPALRDGSARASHKSRRPCTGSHEGAEHAEAVHAQRIGKSAHVIGPVEQRAIRLRVGPSRLAHTWIAWAALQLRARSSSRRAKKPSAPQPPYALIPESRQMRPIRSCPVVGLSKRSSWR